MTVSQKLNTLFQKRSMKYGVPFLVLMVAGSFGLEQFTQLRYQFSKRKAVSPEEMEKIGVKMKKAEEVTLETEYEKVKRINIDEWENKRGPRPWEESE